MHSPLLIITKKKKSIFAFALVWINGLVKKKKIILKMNINLKSLILKLQKEYPSYASLTLFYQIFYKWTAVIVENCCERLFIYVGWDSRKLNFFSRERKRVARDFTITNRKKEKLKRAQN